MYIGKLVGIYEGRMASYIQYLIISTNPVTSRTDECRSKNKVKSVSWANSLRLCDSSPKLATYHTTWTWTHCKMLESQWENNELLPFICKIAQNIWFCHKIAEMSLNLLETLETLTLESCTYMCLNKTLPNAWCNQMLTLERWWGM